MIFTILLILIIIGLIFYIYQLKSRTSAITSNSIDNICMNYSNEPMNTMHADAVQNMVDNYSNNQLDKINTGIRWQDQNSDSDSTSILFKLETLKKFIYHIERESKKHGIQNVEHLGLRIYYSAYPDAKDAQSWQKQQHEDFRDLPFSYKRRHTLVMVPAKLNETDGQFHDYNPVDNNLYTARLEGSDLTYIDFKIDSKIVSESSIPALAISGSDGSTNDPSGMAGSLNHGSLIKPGNGLGASL